MSSRFLSTLRCTVPVITLFAKSTARSRSMFCTIQTSGREKEHGSHVLKASMFRYSASSSVRCSNCASYHYQSTLSSVLDHCRRDHVIMSPLVGYWLVWGSAWRRGHVTLQQNGDEPLEYMNSGHDTHAEAERRHVACIKYSFK